jgi:hypothetical protein
VLDGEPVRLPRRVEVAFTPVAFRALAPPVDHPDAVQPVKTAAALAKAGVSDKPARRKPASKPASQKAAPKKAPPRKAPPGARPANPRKPAT